MPKKKRDPTPGAPPTATTDDGLPPSTGSFTRDFIRAFALALKQSHATRNALLQIAAVTTVTIGFAIYSAWSVFVVVVVFWLQNIIIGLFTVLKLVTWPNLVFPDVGDMTGSSKTLKILAFVVLFFGVNVMCVFPFRDFLDIGAVVDSPTVQVALDIFAANLALSFAQNYRRDTAAPAQWGDVATQAFIRIAPLYVFPLYAMPIVIPAMMLLFLAYFLGADEAILGRLSSTLLPFALALFMVLKGVADVFAYMVSHTKQPLTIRRS
jgi:hypothetical protein